MASVLLKAALPHPTCLGGSFSSRRTFLDQSIAVPLLTHHSASSRQRCRCQKTEEGKTIFASKASKPDVATSEKALRTGLASREKTSRTDVVLHSFVAPLVLSGLAAADAPAGGYSQASYYTTLGLFVLSAPGLWSLIKRSTKSKIVQKTFIVDGPAKTEAKPLDKVASDIATFFKANNYDIAGTGEVITFEGNVAPSRGQAAFLTFCAALGLLSIALVLSIAVPDIGEKWYGMTLLSPLAGVYYWRKASRREKIKVKMVTSDDETSTDIIVEGDDEEIERFRRGLEMQEKGKIYVKGLLER